MYACFDQPDLKATFTFHVTVPDEWVAASNGALLEEEQLRAGKVLHFATTERMSPYITALVAGPYHVERDHHDGIDLGLWCRKSLASTMDSAELFEITKQGFDWYHANFGVRYAFGKYDQLFVPEFNAGAMENAGCVTFHEDYLFRSKVTDARYERRAATILHEMAHMWFGDLVTMRWWDDLWLNESFADYACTLCQTAGDAVDVGVDDLRQRREDLGLPAGPAAVDAPDRDRRARRADRRAELRRHHLRQGRQRAQAARRLRRRRRVPRRAARLLPAARVRQHHAGRPALRARALVRAAISASGASSGSRRPASTRSVPSSRSTPRAATPPSSSSRPRRTTSRASNVLRPHRLAIGRYDERGDKLDRIGRVEVDLVGARTPVPELVGVAQPPLLLINDDDLTYCKMRLDDTSLATLRDGGIERLVDSLPRAVTWSGTWDMLRDGELATRDYVAMVIAGAHLETDIGVMQSLLRQARRAIEIYADPQWSPTGYRLLADASLERLRSAQPGSDQQLAWAHSLLAAACTDEHLDVASGLLDGSVTIDGLAVDPDLRWALVETLSAHGRISAEAIDAELERDPSAAGQRHAATARALVPTAQAKAETWDRIVGDDTLPNAMQRALLNGFAHHTQGELLAPYVQRYFDDIGGGLGPALERGRAGHRGAAVPDLGRGDRRPTPWPPPTRSWPGPRSRRRCAGSSSRDARTSCGRCGRGRSTPRPSTAVGTFCRCLLPARNRRCRVSL